ncbi:MAG: helix-turn-helix domain-containing protein [Pseudobutyrivibrio sp.]|nr:helix-turn-helix domain-containing protein [Pseudobutyrivibrio sp.]
MATIGERIREVREEAGITRQELAELTGLGKSTIANWELNINGVVPSSDSIFKVADALDISYSWLARGEGDKKSRKEKSAPGYISYNKPISDIRETRSEEEARLKKLPAISYSEIDKQNLENINTIIRTLRDANLTLEQKKACFLTLSQFRTQIESKMLFAESERVL